MIQRWRQEFLEALGRDAWEGLKNLDSSVSFEHFTELHEFVTQHYRLVAHMTGRFDYQIFWRIEPDQPAAKTTP